MQESTNILPSQLLRQRASHDLHGRILIPDFLLLRDAQIYKKPSCAQLSRSLSLAICLLFGTVSYSSQQIRSITSPWHSSANFITSQGLHCEISLVLNICQLPAGWKPLQQLDIRSSTSNLRLSSAILDFNSCFGRKS